MTHQVSLKKTLFSGLLLIFFTTSSASAIAAEWQTQSLFFAENTIKVVIPSLPGTYARPKGTVIFIEGFGAFHEKYKEVHEHIARRGYTVVAYALLGQGERRKLGTVQIPNSTQEAGGHFQAYLDQLESVIRLASPKDKVTLVGHSLGGGIALAYAERNPERIRKVVTVAPMTGLPFALDTRSARIFSKKLFGVRARVSLKYDPTLDAVRAAIEADKGLWDDAMDIDNVVGLLAKKLRVHFCVSPFLGSICKDRWVSVKPEMIKKALPATFADQGLALDGETGVSGEAGMPIALPTLLNLKNLIEAEQYLREPKAMANLAKLDVTVISSENRDPLTPLAVTQDFRHLADLSSGRVNTLSLTVHGDDVIDMVGDRVEVPAAAGHSIWILPEIQEEIAAAVDSAPAH